MPQGTGTYGYKVGRPPKKKKKPASRSGMGMASYQRTAGVQQRKKKKK